MIPGIGLGNENRAFGINSETVKKSSESIDCFNQFVGFSIENEKIFVGDFRMLDDINNVTQRENVIIGYRMLVSIKSNEVAINFIAAGELGFVIRFEGDHIELTVPDLDRTRVLSGNIKALGDLAGGNVNDSDLIFG